MRVLSFIIPLFVLMTLIALLYPSQTYAQRFATCDLCGYCQNSSPPGDWEKCRECLYPNTSSDPNVKDTLKIDDTVANPSAPTPQPGRYYSGIGCIKTDLTDFSQQGAAGSVVQKILDVLFSIGGGIAFLYIIYGSFLFITSQADPERLGYAKRTIVGAIVGLIFCMGSVFLVNLIGAGILHLPGFSTGSGP